MAAGFPGAHPGSGSRCRSGRPWLLPEGAGRDVGLVVSGRIEGLGLDEGDLVSSKSTQDVFEERRADPLVALVVSHSDPEDLGRARRPVLDHGEADHAVVFRDDPAVVCVEVAGDLVGHIVGEEIGQPVNDRLACLQVLRGGESHAHGGALSLSERATVAL